MHAIPVLLPDGCEWPEVISVAWLKFFKATTGNADGARGKSHFFPLLSEQLARAPTTPFVFTVSRSTETAP